MTRLGDLVDFEAYGGLAERGPAGGITPLEPSDWAPKKGRKSKARRLQEELAMARPDLAAPMTAKQAEKEAKRLRGAELAARAQSPADQVDRYPGVGRDPEDPDDLAGFTDDYLAQLVREQQLHEERARKLAFDNEGDAACESYWANEKRVLDALEGEQERRGRR